MAFEWLEFVEPCSGTPYAVSLHSHQAVWGSPPAMLQEGFSQKFDPIGKTWLYSGTSVSNSKSAPLRPFPLRPGQLDKKPSTTAASTFAPISASSSDNVGILPVSSSAPTIGASSSNSPGGNPPLQSSLTTGNVKSLSPMLPDKSARAALNPEMAFEPYAKTQFVKGTFKPGKGLKYVGKQAGPVLQSIKDAGLSKEAVNLFKDLQIICGELKPAKNQTVGEVVRQILMLCDSMPMFKDECLIQAVRHTCANPKPPVQQKAWEYLVICCLHFVPSKALEPFLLDYLRQRVQGDIKDHPARAAASALRNLKICEKRASVATVGSPVEIEGHLKNAFQPYMFGLPLPEIMANQKPFHPDLQVPAVVLCCIDQIKALGGKTLPGIFRIPGDTDTVNYLKLHIESGELSPLPTADPKDVCSLLSLWMRELPEALFPDKFYDPCLELSKQSAIACVAILEQLPPVNRAVIIEIIHLFQELSREEVTKMTVSNLALISAPNFLRCPDQSQVVMLQNAKQEIQFMSYLIETLP